MRKSALFLVLLVLGAISAIVYVYFRDTTGPIVALHPASGYVTGKQPLDLELSDPGSGLRSVVVTVTQGDKTTEVLKKSYEKGVTTIKEPLILENARLKDAPFELEVVALDRSIYRFGAGAKTRTISSLTYDSRPPVLNILSAFHNVLQGGAGCIVYTISKDVAKSGVIVDDLFFPGYKQDNGNYICLFAFPYYLAPAKFVPKLIAVDQAGNERAVGFNFQAKPRSFRRDSLNISDSFLDSKMVQFEAAFPDAKSPLEIFLQVNKVMRIQNAKRLFDIGSKTDPKPLWDGAFLRMPNAAPMASFGDVRSYYHNGEKIDEQTHLGIDLASLIQSPVPAANNGRVVMAEFLGIYGNCVIVDHGLGLQSLYAHMSQINVQVGDMVQKGQTVGVSGATGMAGGDHLHFGINIAGLPVMPIEWWDGHWIRDNVTDKFSGAPQPTRVTRPAGEELTGKAAADLPPKKKKQR